MNTERLFKIVIMELTSDNLKIQEELEKAMNSEMEITSKTQLIKSLLHKLVESETSLAKFSELVSKNNNNNNEIKTQENGKN